MPDNRRRSLFTLFTRDAAFTVARFAQTDTAGKTATLSGYAIRWNSLSDDRGGYKVRLLPGSAKFITPTMALFHHDFAAIIGNTANNTLRILPDDVGVKVEIDLPNTTLGRDVAELVEKGYVGGMSFAMVSSPTFTMKTEGPDKQQVMEVSAFEADEVTVTAIPSFADTSIQVTAPGEPIAAAKNSEPVKHRHAHGWKLQKMRLSGLSR
jgi:HK97 family phage prohead protease